MPSPVQINGLQVLGYDDRLTANMWPAIVSPILALPDGNYLFAPYVFREGMVLGGKVVSPVRYHQLVDNEEITVVATPIEAQADFELWINPDGETKYEPMGDVEESLQEIASKSVEDAKTALQAGNLDEANRLCRLAFRANDKLVDSIAIWALVAEEKGNGLRQAPLLQELIKGLVTPMIFETIVKSLRKNHLNSSREENTRSCSPMSGMAALKPELVAA